MYVSKIYSLCFMRFLWYVQLLLLLVRFLNIVSDVILGITRLPILPLIVLPSITAILSNSALCLYFLLSSLLFLVFFNFIISIVYIILIIIFITKRNIQGFPSFLISLVIIINYNYITILLIVLIN